MENTEEMENIKPTDCPSAANTGTTQDVPSIPPQSQSAPSSGDGFPDDAQNSGNTEDMDTNKEAQVPIHSATTHLNNPSTIQTCPYGIKDGNSRLSDVLGSSLSQCPVTSSTMGGSSDVTRTIPDNETTGCVVEAEKASDGSLVPVSNSTKTASGPEGTLTEESTEKNDKSIVGAVSSQGVHNLVAGQNNSSDTASSFNTPDSIAPAASTAGHIVRTGVPFSLLSVTNELPTDQTVEGPFIRFQPSWIRWRKTYTPGCIPGARPPPGPKQTDTSSIARSTNSRRQNAPRIQREALVPDSSRRVTRRSARIAESQAQVAPVAAQGSSSTAVSNQRTLSGGDVAQTSDGIGRSTIGEASAAPVLPSKRRSASGSNTAETSKSHGQVPVTDVRKETPAPVVNRRTTRSNTRASSSNTQNPPRGSSLPVACPAPAPEGQTVRGSAQKSTAFKQQYESSTKDSAARCNPSSSMAITPKGPARISKPSAQDPPANTARARRPPARPSPVRAARARVPTTALVSSQVVNQQGDRTSVQVSASTPAIQKEPSPTPGAVTGIADSKAQGAGSSRYGLRSRTRTIALTTPNNNTQGTQNTSSGSGNTGTKRKRVGAEVNHSEKTGGKGGKRIKIKKENRDEDLDTDL